MIRNRIESGCIPVVGRFDPTPAPYEVMVTEEVFDNGTVKEISREKIKWCNTLEELREV